MPDAGEPSACLTLPETRVSRRTWAVTMAPGLSGSRRDHFGCWYDGEDTWKEVPGWMFAGSQSNVATPCPSVSTLTGDAVRLTELSLPFLRTVQGLIATPGTGFPDESTAWTRTVRTPSRMSPARSGGGNQPVGGQVR